MDKRAARRAFISEWMLEFSVLWAVFPLLDQLLRHQIETWLLVVALILVMVSFTVGIMLRRDS